MKPKKSTFTLQMELIAERLRVEKTRNRLTNEKIGKSLGKSHATISCWFRTPEMMQLEDLYNLCRVLGISVSELLEGVRR